MKINMYRIITIITFMIIAIITILISTNYILKKENKLLAKKHLIIANNIQNKIKSIIEKKNNATLALTITLSSNTNVLDILNHKKDDIQLNILSLLLRKETAF